MNDAGDIVGLTSNNGVNGFFFDGSNFSAIEVPNSKQTIATGINNDGVVTGSFFFAGFDPGHGFVKIGESYFQLDVPLDFVAFTSPGGINDKGQVAGIASGEEPGVGRRNIGFIATPCSQPGPNCVELRVVPEPTTISLVVVGLLALLFFVRQTSEHG